MANCQQIEPEPKPKKQKIKILELTQKNFATIGIHPNLVDQSYPFNGKNLLLFLLLTSSVICNLMYVIREAKTFDEYTQSVYMLSFAILTAIGSVSLLWNVTELFNLINGFENLANTSK